MSAKSIILVLAVLAFAGCSSDNDPSAPSQTYTAEKDAAAAIAADLGADDGGLVDQLSDAVGFAGALDVAAKSGCEGMRDAVYDEATGTWTITIERERGVPDGVPYASFTRVYTLRFLDADGVPQMHYLVDGVAARTIEFAILSGSGVHRTFRVEQNLLALEGEFIITNADQELVTVNGWYLRSGSNLLEAPRFRRTHESTLQLTLADVVAPRGAGRDLAAAVSGTVSGVYDALITIERGDAYTEREIHREFTITLGDGEGLMTMARTGNRYRAQLRTGELVGE